MSATNKDSDEEAERASNDGGENLDETKDNDGRENLDETKDDDGRENLDDTCDKDGEEENLEDTCHDDNGEAEFRNDQNDKPEMVKGPGQEIAGEDKALWKVSLYHNGPYFPPEYEPLPDSVHFYYDNERVKLEPKTEEMATLYAKSLDMLKGAEMRKTFDRNFFKDWQETMTEQEKLKITHLSKCCFGPMRYHLAEKGAEKKSISEEVKKKFGYCTLDGESQQVQNWQITEPRCYLPVRSKNDENIGRIIKRVEPKDVTVNCSSDCDLANNEREKWSEVMKDPTVGYLAKWKNHVTKKWNYMNLYHIFLRAEIFKLALKLSENIQKVREEYWKDLDSEDDVKRLMGVVLYMVERFSIRSGTKKTEDPEDPTGVCTLKKSHITLSEDNGKFSILFDFIGKDGIAYKKKYTVEKRVYEILQELKKDSESEDLFPGMKSTEVNKRLKEIMPNLTIKVFRTYNGSLKMQNELEKATPDLTKGKSVYAVYRGALEKVAAYLNHQQAAPSPAKKKLDPLVEQMSTLSLNSTTPTKKNTDGPPTEMKWNSYGSEKSYIDHRVVILWCKKNDILIKYIYTEKARGKLEWEIEEVEKLSEKLKKEKILLKNFYYYS